MAVSRWALRIACGHRSRSVASDITSVMKGIDLLIQEGKLRRLALPVDPGLFAVCETVEYLSHIESVAVEQESRGRRAIALIVRRFRQWVAANPFAIRVTELEGSDIAATALPPAGAKRSRPAESTESEPDGISASAAATAVADGDAPVASSAADTARGRFTGGTGAASPAAAESASPASGSRRTAVTPVPASAVIVALTRLGLLVRTPGTGGCLICVPEAAELQQAIVRHRLELVRRVRATRYQEVPRAELEARACRVSPLPAKDHVADAVGAGWLVVVETAAGQVLRIGPKAPQPAREGHTARQRRR